MIANQHQKSFFDKCAILLLLLLPFNEVTSIVGSFGLFDLVAVILSLLFFPYIIAGVSWWTRKALFLVLILILSIVLAWFFAFFDNSVDADAMFRGLTSISFGFLLLPLVCAAFFNKRLFGIFNNIVLLYSVIILICYVGYFVFGLPLVKQTGTVRFAPILAGIQYITLISLAWAGFQYLKGKKSIYFLAFVLLVCFLNTLFFEQRGLFLALIVEVLIIFLYINPIKTLLVVLLLVLFVSIYVSTSDVSINHTRLLNTSELFHAQSRVSILYAFMHALSDSPLRFITGWGHGVWGYGIAHQPPHNLLLSYLASFGIISALGFFVFTFYPLFTARRQPYYRIYYFIVMSGIFAFYLVHPYSSVRSYLFFTILLTYYSLVHRHDNEEQYE